MIENCEAMDLALRLYEMAHGREWDQDGAVKRYHTDSPTRLRTEAMAEMLLRANRGGQENPTCSQPDDSACWAKLPSGA